MAGSIVGGPPIHEEAPVVRREDEVLRDGDAFDEPLLETACREVVDTGGEVSPVRPLGEIGSVDQQAAGGGLEQAVTRVRMTRQKVRIMGSLSSGVVNLGSPPSNLTSFILTRLSRLRDSASSLVFLSSISISFAGISLRVRR